MPKTALWFYIGDTHVLSDTGLAIDGYEIGSKEKKPYVCGDSQKWLMSAWRDAVEFIELASLDYRVGIGFGGDIKDGTQHHGSTQTHGTPEDQRQMSFELLKPLVSVATWAYGILGTEAHTGPQGDDDRAIYTMLGIDYYDKLEAQIEGHTVLHAHHGVPVGTRDHTIESGAISLLKDIQARRKDEGKPHPSAIIGHDRHRSFRPLNMRDTWIAVCPCWQLPTYYGNNWPFSDVSIGFLMWDVQHNKLERVTYRQESHVKRFI
ncbi:MAG: hypothetical protein IPO08_20315 [Xanthomonadales bacterium]|nr:hypothetical protein [Xanthomonadales bacterium]